MNLKGFGNSWWWTNRDTIPSFSRRDCGKPQKTLIRTPVSRLKFEPTASWIQVHCVTTAPNFSVESFRKSWRFAEVTRKFPTLAPKMSSRSQKPDKAMYPESVQLVHLFTLCFSEDPSSHIYLGRLDAFRPRYFTFLNAPMRALYSNNLRVPDLIIPT
jgi:hypothetical protein